MTYREHLDIDTCWCHPILYYTAPNGAEVWLHREADGSTPPAALMLEVCEAAALGVERDVVVAA